MDARRGLAAVGRSGQLQLDLDETLGDSAEWTLVVDAPVVYLHIQVDGPDVIRQLLTFFKATAGRKPPVRQEMSVGKCFTKNLALVMDDEHGDRYFVRLGDATDGYALFNIVGPWADHIIVALTQMVDDLSKE